MCLCDQHHKQIVAKQIKLGDNYNMKSGMVLSVTEKDKVKVMKIDAPYYLDYCAKPCALYVNNILITEDARGAEFELLNALGYKDSKINQKQVCQDWIESRGFKFPKHLRHVKFLKN